MQAVRFGVMTLGNLGQAVIDAREMGRVLQLQIDGTKDTIQANAYTEKEGGIQLGIVDENDDWQTSLSDQPVYAVSNKTDDNLTSDSTVAISLLGIRKLELVG